VTLPTLAGLRSRGITPEAIWRLILFVGIKETDATITLSNLYAYNRQVIEPIANRYMFVRDPVRLRLIGVNGPIKAKLPMHPSYPERGFRFIEVKDVVYIQRNDVKVGVLIRLMGLGNIKITKVNGESAEAEFLGQDIEEARRAEAPIIQWAPPNAVEAEVTVPVDVGKVNRDRGLAEPAVAGLEVGTVMQFIRYGFVKLTGVEGGMVKLVYVHD